jgi:hypothetical protein
VFAQYGSSTKRDSNEAVGMLGIGSKSGFAYSDTFTIISRHGGKKRTYIALLDESENDALSLLNEEDNEDPNDTGLTIEISVRLEDIREFERKAVALFEHFEPRPNINIQLPAPAAIKAKLKEGVVYDRKLSYYEQDGWYAVMGCIPYKIDLEQLKDANGESLVSESFDKCSGLLYFKIGEVQINASREMLKYSKITKEVLVKKFEVVLEEYVKTVLDEIENGSGTNWEKRINTQLLLNIGLGKKEIGDFAETTVSFNPEPQTFSLSTSIPVGTHTRLIRKTDVGRRSIEGFKLGQTYKDVLIIPKRTPDPSGQGLPTHHYPWNVVNAELDKLIQEFKIEGIKIENLDTLPWLPKNVSKGGVVKIFNPKHQVSTFKLTDTRRPNLTRTGNGNVQWKQSDNWTVEDRQPTPDDVFVIISQFETESIDNGTYFDIYPERQKDSKIAKAYGLTLPEIYGYKTTNKKPVKIKDIVGIHYLEWRKKFHASLPADKTKELIQHVYWHRAATQLANGPYNSVRLSKKNVESIQANLGETHPIAIYVSKAFFALSNQPVQNLIEMLEDLDIPVNTDSKPEEFKEQILTTYPLLRDTGLHVLWTENATEWKRYIRLVDGANAELKDAPYPVTFANIFPPETEEG